MRDKSDKSTGDLFGMIPSDPTDTQVEAAEAVAPHRSELQAKVLHVLQTHGPMTDMELDSLPQFAHYAERTVSKRRTDLLHMGYVRDSGRRRLNENRRYAIVWEAVPPEEVGVPQARPKGDPNLEAAVRGAISIAEYGRRCERAGYTRGYRIGRKPRVSEPAEG